MVNDQSEKNERTKKWKILHKPGKKEKKTGTGDIIDILLDNRGLKTKAEKDKFFNPISPEEISLKELGLVSAEINKAIKRIKKAKEKKEKVIVYGDYDADGVTATAVMWECLYALEVDALPYIPERFSEGYGLNSESIKKLKKEYPNLGLIITVDNGITTVKEVKAAKKLGIDVIVTDHHQKPKKLPQAFSIIHTTKTSGSALAWIFAREIRKKLEVPESKIPMGTGLDLVALGTIADQLPLLGVNRSFVKFGLVELNNTNRPGLNALIKTSAIKKGFIGTYAVGFMLAPRINAMGRLEHAIDSLRLLCTKDGKKAESLAMHLGKTNSKRQQIVGDVVLHAREAVKMQVWKGPIIISHESYHEGVIGLAASKLVEEFFRPVIVISKGEKYSKASARSVPGFNIIEMIKKMDSLLEASGGHPMAAGFTIKTERLGDFSKKIERESQKSLTEELLLKEIKVDMELGLKEINWELVGKLKEFEPVGLGNPSPSFTTNNVRVIDPRGVGADGKHLKLAIEKEGIIFDAIAFGQGEQIAELSKKKDVDLVYALDENVWGGERNIQLKVKDIRLNFKGK